MKKNSYETILYSVAGVAILLVIIIAVNALTGEVKQRVDFTKDKAYTLSAGTRAILQKLDTPVKIRFYYSRSDNEFGDTQMLKSYAQHVADLLDEYKQAAKGKIVIEQFDPKPDSDAEDSAKLDGVEGQMLRSGEKFYMGLSVSLLDNKEAISFLDPGRERLLEYDLSRAISRVAAAEKPIVGIMTPLPLLGKPSNPMMAQMGKQSGSDPWAFVTELRNEFTVRPVEMTATSIDPDIKVLFVVHPKDISDSAQYAIDQFIMRGGKLIAFLDATSLADSHTDNPMMGQMPGGGSSLDRLIKAWGLAFDSSKVVADMKYKAKTMGRNNQPTDLPAFLVMTEDAINKDDVATSELHDVWYPFGGAFSGTPVAGLKETVLLKSSKDSELVDGMMASFSGENIMRDFKPSGTEYPLAIRLTGRFKTAFPEGKPKDPKDESKPATTTPDDSLKETKVDNAVVLFGDADLLSDQFALRPRQTIFGPMGYEPANGNLILVQNLADQMGGDNNLIAIRSRAALDRPFKRINEMKAKAEESYQSKIKEFEASLQETREKVNELQSKKQDGQQRFVLSPEQQAELEKLKKKEGEVNGQLKLERKKLSHDINSLENNLKWADIIGMPAIVALSGIGLAIFKRKRTSAK